MVSFHSTSKGVIGECGRRGGYMELHNIDPYVQSQLNKLASSGLCSNLGGQVMMSLLMVNPPVAGYIPSTVSFDHGSLVTEGTFAAATSATNLEDATMEQLLAAPPAPDVTFREVVDAIWESIIGANGERKLPLAHLAVFSGIVATLWTMNEIKPAYHVVAALFG